MDQQAKQFIKKHMVPLVIMNANDDKINGMVFFVVRLIQEQHSEVKYLYKTAFPKLTDQSFKALPWPEAKDVSPYINDDPIFLNLCKELY